MRVTDTTIEIVKEFRRIAFHKRLCGCPEQYSTVLERMSPNHQKYLEWNCDCFRKWAETIGINTYKVVDSILTAGRVEQQSYRKAGGKDNPLTDAIMDRLSFVNILVRRSRHSGVA